MSAFQIRCPACQQVIPPQDVNVATDVAYCRPCNKAMKLSDRVYELELDPNVDLERPPHGTWYSNSALGTIIGATQRSVSGALGTLAFGLFWNGIVSVFVLVAIVTTLKHLGITLPHWFPKLNAGSMGVGMTIFLWIFLLPFIVVGLAFIAAFFSYVAGRNEVRLNSIEGVVVTGVGPFIWRRRFQRDSVKDVRIERKTWRDSEGDNTSKLEIIIELHNGKQIKFGSSLRKDRLRFLASGLHKLLVR